MTADLPLPTDDEYVPDAEATAKAVVDSFFDHLAAHVQHDAVPDDFVPRMRAELAELESANAHRVVDQAAAANLRMTLAVVVADRALRPQIGREATLAALRAAFIEPLADIVHDSTRAMLDAAEDPFAAMVASAKAREKHTFGAGFTFDRRADDDQRYHVDVVRCFYYQVLDAHSATDLAPLMCDFDTNWMGAIDPAQHGFRFERATTIGYGGARCPFYWDRVQS
ncbi:L-2-amino-thiazoline-4-carboxylic acid hydrolase [Amycolatopsis albispora]|uniref:L-2-amino-thiazoline-4-carboxylic acid hydrolase n=1 Tax=Amycolatopsis albispora TaxID=1804986 RepID=A0A344LB27_9PSEU|nr:L-2-amino-thiazoline-4-carboxylic acid hydrolase [Amycolatopsis albispora]AXB45251.1 hypothetical protein A4R43_24385 [Amycolatopsis albispora]